LKYKLPSTRYFSLAYPEVIVLSPGMFKELDVVFRPVQNHPYDDSIYFKMIEGEDKEGFHVPVRALISKLQVSSPFGVDLGYCTTHQITTKVFQLENFGEVDAPFRWEVPYPFKLTPDSGIIPIGHKQDIEVSVSPVDASVFVSQALCYVGEGVHAIIPDPVLSTKLSAIGKYAYIIVSEDVVDFGEVLTGTAPDSIKKEIMLRNQSVVPAEFQCTRVENDRDGVFELFPMSGVIAPLSEIAVTIKYSARASGCYSRDEFVFSTPGKCHTSVQCSGLSMAPKVVLHKDGTTIDRTDNKGGDLKGSPIDSINFNDAEVGTVVTRIFFLKNFSGMSTYFSVQGDEEGVFQIYPNKGHIPAAVEVPVKLTFCPQLPINYYRRIFVLINDALPLLFDVMGTGYIRAHGEIKEQRPAPIRHAHVQAYRNRCTQGLDRLNPDEMDLMLSEQGISDLFARVGLAGTRPMSVALLKNPLTRTGEASRIDVAPAHELFIEDTEPLCRGITVDTTELDFGYTPYDSASSARTVTVTNHTNGKVSLVWIVPNVHTDKETHEGAGTSSNPALNAPVFHVDPPTSEIGSNKTVKFRITFNPKQSNRNYVNEIEVYGFFKNQRTFRLVNDATLTPPWCLTVKAVGHTFAGGQLPTTVKLSGGSIHNGKLAFPTCYAKDSVFQVVKVVNSSNLSCTFKFKMGFVGGDGLEDTKSATRSDDDEIFSVRPMCGEIGGEDFALICVRFTPKTNKKYIQLLRCLVNGGDGGQLLLEGIGSLPQLTCPEMRYSEDPFSAVKIGTIMPTRPYPDDFFSLNPTSVGLTSTRQLKVKNSSRLPLRFYCTLPPSADGIIHLNPSSGFLRGNDSMNIEVTFMPQYTGRVSFKMGVKVYPIGGSPSKVIDGRQAGQVSKVQPLQDFKINIAGQGGVGAIVFDPPRLATDVILVNTQELRYIVLENITDNTLSYELHYRMNFVPETGSSHSSMVFSPLQPLRTTFQSTDGSAANHQNVFSEKPVGFINARSRKTIPFCFKPNRAGLFDFIVYCRLKSVSDDGEEAIVSNEESALRHVSQVLYEKRIDSNAISVLDNLPLTMTVTGRASFPTLIIQDIRPEYDTLIADVAQLWRQFSIPEINYELAQPLTDDQVAFNTTSSPDFRILKRYNLNFTPDVIGNPRQTVFLKLCNNGFLTTTFHIHLPNEKELDLEQWCDEEELTEERLMQISILEELKVFEIEPHGGVLQPGESMLLTISYSHTSLKYNGFHKLPVLMKLDQGKQFWLDMIGTTLADGNVIMSPTKTPASIESPKSILVLACTGSDGIYGLNSVPIGLPTTELPMHRIELVNVSAVDAAYEVDISNLKNIVRDNFDRDIFTILNPQGTILARSSTFLECVFTPLEAQLYDVPMVVKYIPLHLVDQKESKSRRRSVSEGKALLLNTHFLRFTLRGLGYDTRFQVPSLPGQDRVGANPPKMRLVELDTTCTLSEDYIDFGIVPKCYKSSRLMVIRSNNPTHDVEFVVDDTLSYFKELNLLTITPSSGVIPPLGLAVIDIQFYAGLQPALITDRIKIMVQAIVKGAQKRANGSRHDKIKDRLKNARKVNLNHFNLMCGYVKVYLQIGTAEHTSVIVRHTAARSQYIEHGNMTNQRVAKYPTTMVPKEMVRTASAGNVNRQQPAPSPLVLERTYTGDSNLTRSVNSANAGTTSGGSRGYDSENGLATASHLRGPPEYYVVRIHAEVYSAQVVGTLFEKGEEKKVLDAFIAPIQIPFIPPRNLRNVSSGRATGEVDMPASASLRNKTILVDRDYELRFAVDAVMRDIFMDVLHQPDTTEQVSRGYIL
jgi:hypothetical protein